MPRSAKERATGPGRRLMFAVWTGLTVVVAVYIGVTAPLTTYLHEDLWIVAVAIPPLMIVLLGIGLGWLVWTSAAGSSRSRDPR
ncbi:hypothetical protein [Roseospira navarrensis]|uniref:Uncharacterized protein n=1 Tax=Roseospira navarrensis TaxID=140058 RepID=A0A7X2D622_9PROT|nr:hypothetical protein [Roseospira navarrensis]MQX38272.1 hypothetical protein [Roseospira navarrensis]